jgi:hypothetical protein
MVSWADSKKRERRCGVIVVRDYGQKYPCANLRPCPLHGRKPILADEPRWWEDEPATERAEGFDDR